MNLYILQIAYNPIYYLKKEEIKHNGQVADIAYDVYEITLKSDQNE